MIRQTISSIGTAKQDVIALTQECLEEIEPTEENDKFVKEVKDRRERILSVLNDFEELFKSYNVTLTFNLKD